VRSSQSTAAKQLAEPCSPPTQCCTSSLACIQAGIFSFHIFVLVVPACGPASRLRNPHPQPPNSTHSHRTIATHPLTRLRCLGFHGSEGRGRLPSAALPGVPGGHLGSGQVLGSRPSPGQCAVRGQEQCTFVSSTAPSQPAMWQPLPVTTSTSAPPSSPTYPHPPSSPTIHTTRLPSPPHPPPPPGCPPPPPPLPPR
jgi:hypothetical protein